jgi:Collagen triple helix repeat (20 copies)
LARRARTATGVVAALAAGVAVIGPGAAAASSAGGPTRPAPTPTSTSKIYACYSDSTDALSYLDYPTDKTCPSGQTMVEWNKPGAAGSRGSQGAQGAQGATGRTGPQGAAGAPGAQGARGKEGGAGTQGAAGAAGAAGTAGAGGAAGAAGTSGSKGVTGPAGAAGPQGRTGPQGTVGAQGPQGSTGPAGATGVGGAQGPVGPTGFPGPGGIARDANSANFQNAVKLNSYDAGGTVVNTVTVAVDGHYEVNANADLTQYRLPAGCEIRVVSQDSRTFSSTPLVYASNNSPGTNGTVSGTVAENGIVSVSVRSVIQQVCFAASKSATSQVVSAYGGAELTAMLVTSYSNNGVLANGARAHGPAAAGTGARAARPSNRFVNPFALRRHDHRGHRATP